MNCNKKASCGPWHEASVYAGLAIKNSLKMPVVGLGYFG